MLGVFEMVAIIVVSALLAGLAKEWIKTKDKPDIDLEPMESRIDRLEFLEERIKVLEAIVTDKGYDLKSKIDSL
jgi:membrane protein implicated in regulation of membrane protease activity